jgi:hypothetical protein
MSFSSAIALCQGVFFFVVEIEDRCFERVNIRRLVISRNVELLGESCFGLAKIQFFATEADSHLRYFESDAFAFIQNLSVLFIPGDWTLSLSSSRQTCPPLDMKSFLLRSGANFRGSTISARMFLGSLSLILVYIPSSVTILGESCFSVCRSLSMLVLESNCQLDRIESGASYGCSSLKSICIPSSVTILGKSCFSKCHSLSTVAFDSNCQLDRIESNAFLACSSLKSICIPSSVTILGESCFGGCGSLSTLTFESNCQLDRIESESISGMFLTQIVFYSSLCIFFWRGMVRPILLT